jgi:replicative DNA helicase
LEIVEKLYSTQTEEDVIATVLNDSECAYSAIARLRPDTFYNLNNQQIFSAVTDIYRAGNQADMVSVANHLEASGKLEAAGGRDWIVSLATACRATREAYPFIEDKVVRLKKARDMWKLCHDSIVYLEDSPADSIDRLLEQHSLFAVNGLSEGQREKPMMIGELAREYLEQLEHRYNEGSAPGLTTTFTSLDEYISFHPGQLTILAARPGMGKSALAMQMSYRLASQGKTCLFFSLEMSRGQLLSRIFSHDTQIFHDRLERPSYLEGPSLIRRLTETDWAMLTATQAKLVDMPLVIHEGWDSTISRVAATCHSIRAQKKGIDLIVVDYLQLITPQSNSRASRNDEVSEISRQLKMLAKKMECPIIALSQLNRKVEERQNKRPLLADLRDSGSLEQDADIVLFVYRDERYNPETEDKGIAEVIIAKNRQGEEATVKLLFRNKTITFAEQGAIHVPSNTMDFRTSW